MKSVILPGQKTTGWPKGKKVRELPTGDLKEILNTKWREDVHFVQYGVIDSIGPYRYNNEIFAAPEFEEHKRCGGGIDIICVAFDIDSPAKKSGEPGAIDIWFEDELIKIHELQRAFPGGLVWRTKGGWRGVWNYSRRIVSADDTAAWRKDYLAAIVYLERAFGIFADAACNDWNRLHRVPFGIRDTEATFGWGEPEIRQTIGGLEEGKYFNIQQAPEQQDREEAKRRHLSAWRSAPKERTNKNEAKADKGPNNNNILSIPGVWERIIRNRNAFIRELGPGKLAIQCPNASQHTTAGNETSTVLYLPGSGEIFGHAYCSHTHCEHLDWRTSFGVSSEEWDNVVKKVKEEASPAFLEVDPPEGTLEASKGEETPEEAERRVVSLLVPDKTGLPAPIAYNISLLLTEHPFWKGKLGYDAFKHERYWVQVPEELANSHKFEENRVLSSDATGIQGWLFRGNSKNGRPPIYASIEATRIGIESACSENTFDSLRNHVLGYEGMWDGTPRLETWLVDYMGAEDTPLNRAIGCRWLIASIARALRPGCVADMMPILEGKQEIGKNHVLKIMFGKEFISTPSGLAVGSKDFDQKCADAWCVHDDELVCSRRAGLDVTKSWLTEQNAKFRKAHAVDFITVPRRFVIVGSTNRARYLEDDENRRFWPIYLRYLKSQELIRDRDQIWSEALYYFRADVSYLIPKSDSLWDVLEETHHSKKEENPFVDEINKLISSRILSLPAQLNDILKAIGIGPERWGDMKLQHQIGRALRQAGLATRRTRWNGSFVTLWHSPLEAN